MDKKKTEKQEKKISVEVPFINIPEVQRTEYVYNDGELITGVNGDAPTENSFKFPSKTDVLGSYTGVAENKSEHPVQDADDL